jgi:hypothetical protein
MAENNGKVRFIRVNGRIVPIRADGQRVSRERKSSNAGRPITTANRASIGAAIGAVAGFAFGLKTRKYLKGHKIKLGAGGLAGTAVTATAAAGTNASLFAATGIGSQDENERRKASIGAIGFAVGTAGMLGTTLLARKLTRARQAWAGIGGADVAVNKAKSVLKSIGVKREVQIAAGPNATSLAGVYQDVIQLGTSGKTVILHEASHIKTLKNKFIKDFTTTAAGSGVGKIIPEIMADVSALKSLKSMRQKKMYARSRFAKGMNTYALLAGTEAVSVGTGYYALLGGKRNEPGR